MEVGLKGWLDQMHLGSVSFQAFSSEFLHVHPGVRCWSECSCPRFDFGLALPGVKLNCVFGLHGVYFNVDLDSIPWDVQL